VIGIVASRVVEEVYRPTVLVALQGERGRGSGRSIPAFHLYEALRACARYLERFGGHRHAAGLEIKARDLDAFREAFREEGRARLSAEDLVPVMELDAELDPAGADVEVWRFVRHMAPFGLANPAPLFVARRARIVGPVEPVGLDHVRFGLASARAGRTRPAIAFHRPDLLEWLRPEMEVDLVYRLQESRSLGPGEPEAVVVDLRRGEGTDS
jgi:single-stranded-DNA-specific exonuclease